MDNKENVYDSLQHCWSSNSKLPQEAIHVILYGKVEFLDPLHHNLVGPDEDGS